VRLICMLLFITYCTTLRTQNFDANQEAAIKSTITTMFDGMRAADSTMIQPLFLEGASLYTVYQDQQGKILKRKTDAMDFASAAGQPHDAMWDERIWSYDIKVDWPLASVWTEYTFYLGDRLSHCGVNVFELINNKSRWMISSITDTRRTTGCKSKAQSDLDLLMDSWHQAAAVADEDVFFNTLSDDAIYIGTDPGERWTKSELRSWSQPYFERDTAWSLVPQERNWSIDESTGMAWFDEMLDTWMGPCRASGVCQRDQTGWKLRHYHLSIAVPNDVINDYLPLIGRPSRVSSEGG
ncbi:MAG: nuclear transport factor 2 family protein, partial [Bacteroidota bacterium]